MPKIKAILFDMDMTLLDIFTAKNEGIKAAVQAMLDAGLEMKKEDAFQLLRKEYFKEFHGNNVITNFLKNNNQYHAKILATGINAYRKKKLEFMKPYPDVEETLKELKSLGIKLAVVSDTPGVKVHKGLDILGLSKYFNEVITIDDTGLKKPALAPFQLALKKLNVKSEETMHVGDLPERDIKGAHNAGLTSVHAVYGNILYQKDPYEGKPHYEINNFSELLGIVLELNKK